MNNKSLKEIDEAADKGWWIARQQGHNELMDLFEHIRFHIQKIKEENRLDFLWRSKT